MTIYEIERGVLSILLIDNEKFKELTLEEEHFKDETNRKVFKTINKLYKQNGIVDVKTIHLLVKDKKAFLDYIIEIFSLELTNLNFWHYQDILIENNKEDKIKTLSTSYVNNVINKETFLENVNAIENQYAKNNLYKQFNPDDIYDLITQGQSFLRFYNYNTFNKKIQFLKNTMNIIGARPSIGKSAFALNMFSDLISDYRCIYFNMEMTEHDIWSRLVSINTRIPLNKFKKDKLSDSETGLIKTYLKTMEGKDYNIINGSKSLNQMRKIIINEQRKGHTIVFVDYVGYVFTKENHNDRERIGEVARELQMLTKDYDITVFCLAQINREGEKEPTMANLKDSGELEQSAHTVLLLHDTTDNDNATEVDIDLKIAKNRSGRKGRLKMHFDKNTQRFTEIEL